jgi:ADP-ribose pyrophosphatase YjhB (NUDIX family)
MKFFIKYINKDTILPKQENVSAVFLIALKDSKILAIRNEKGWDIPGGHVEQNETLSQALAREVKEEAGASFSSERLLAIIESDDDGIYKNKVMLIYVTDNFQLNEFVSCEDAFERELIEIEEFLQRSKYNPDFPELIRHAQELLKEILSS